MILQVEQIKLVADDLISKSTKQFPTSEDVADERTRHTFER